MKYHHLCYHLTRTSHQQLQIIISTAFEHQTKAETAALRLANLEVLINAVLYNPGAALGLMEQYRPGTSRAFFDLWFAAINGENKLPRVHDKKLSIMALCALMEMSPSAIPDALKEGWPSVVGGVLRIFKDLPKAVESELLSRSVFAQLLTRPK